ncbi:hypothetical protein BA059_10030 [Mycolicibacterium sp. (ex Dasyatis americana)]|nr:hypothetical protein BA059_10030 [Mycolicibacterium sp. (ex Dasyatis americana)]
MNSEHLWRGTSPDERADDRRERLITACLEIVGDHGSKGLVVRAVCRAANVSPRHFYESFADTDALLLATYERAVSDLLRAVVSDGDGADQAGRTGNARARLYGVFDSATTYLGDHRRAGHLIFREALTNDVLRTRAAVTLPMFLRAVQQIAVTGENESGPSQSHLQAALLSGGLAAVFVEWLSGSAKFTREQLVSYCAEATWAVLSLPEPPHQS